MDVAKGGEHVQKERSQGNLGRTVFREQEELYVPTRTFYENLVLLGDLHEVIQISKVVEKCYRIPARLL